MPTWWTNNPQSGTIHPSMGPTTTVVSPEPFLYRPRALRGLQKSDKKKKQKKKITPSIPFRYNFMDAAYTTVT